jgi:hypothetical protein
MPFLKCAYENIRRAYKNKRILIYSDSQAVLTALNAPKVISRLVADCQDAFFVLANLNEVTLIWVLGHYGIIGNEEADKLARQASATTPLRPEPAFAIPKCLAREEIKHWAEKNILLPGKQYQVANMASFLWVDHVRGELKICLN